MPIRPEHRWLYPIDWRELSAMVRFGRARGRCEHCRRPHGRRVMHLGDGRWWDETLRGRAGGWRDGRGRRTRVEPPRQLRFDDGAGPVPPRSTLVALATAHLDHDPGNNRLRNLADSASDAIWPMTGPNIAAAAPRRSAPAARSGICSGEVRAIGPIADTSMKRVTSKR